MRKWAAALACAAFFASAAGCRGGDDGDSSAGTTTTTTTTSPTAARGAAMSHADARALAEAALPARTDLPARWVVRGGVTDALTAEPAPCTGVEPVAAVARTYRRGAHALPRTRVVVSVHATEAEARAAVRGSASRQFADCVAERFTRRTEGAPTYTVTSSSRFEVPTLGDQRVAVRMALQARRAGEALTLTLDEISIRRERSVLRLELAFGDVFLLTDAAESRLVQAADGVLRRALSDVASAAGPNGDAPPR